MKVCERCGLEIATRDGDSLCEACDQAKAEGRRVRRKASRLEREAALRSLGLVKVKGALGGTYWE